MDRDVGISKRNDLLNAYKSIICGREKISSLLLNIVDLSGNTVLHMAACSKYTTEDEACTFINIIMDRFPSQSLWTRMISSRNCHGYTPLHSAARAGRGQLMKQLIRMLPPLPHDRDVGLRSTILDLREWNGRMWSALHLAVCVGSISCTKTLLLAGADPALLDMGGASAAVLAANNHPSLLPLLSRDWFCQPWMPSFHSRWPSSFQADCRVVLLVLNRLRLPRDVKLSVIVAMGELYRAERLSKSTGGWKKVTSLGRSR